MEKINTMAWGLNDGTFADGGFNIYATAIPDKSLYAGKYLPGYKPVTARRICAEALGACIQAIDLAGALAARDFYKTDLHWSQPSIFGVADALGETMGFDALASKKIGDSIGTAGTFKGVYAGQLALPAAPDALQYVSNPYIDSASVSYLDPKTGAMAPGSVYCPDALTGGGDPYGFFLNGPQPLVVIESAEQASGRTLYLFRDSFGSPLAPLFLRPYDRVVLIDLRYIDSRSFMEENPDTPVVQMDSAEGVKGADEPVFLTIHFVEAELMLAFKRGANTARSVTEVVDMLYGRLGAEVFRELFPLILADQGSGFSNPSAIEKDKDAALLMNHVNSYARKKLGNRSPIDVFSFLHDPQVLELLGIVKIAPDEVALKPSLLKK